MAILNVTYAGRSADAKHLVEDGADDADIRRIAVELIRSGGLAGMTRLEVARDTFRHFVVDRHRDPDGTLRIYLRPKVPFGAAR
jgi:hypothetical protein